MKYFSARLAGVRLLGLLIKGEHYETLQEF